MMLLMPMSLLIIMVMVHDDDDDDGVGETMVVTLSMVSWQLWLLHAGLCSEDRMKVEHPTSNRISWESVHRKLEAVSDVGFKFMLALICPHGPSAGLIRPLPV